MAYTQKELQEAIEILNKPSTHIQCVHKSENGMDFLHYSSSLVGGEITNYRIARSLI